MAYVRVFWALLNAGEGLEAFGPIVLIRLSIYHTDCCEDRGLEQRKGREVVCLVKGSVGVLVEAWASGGKWAHTPAEVFWKENWQVLMMERGAGERGETQRVANISRLVSRITA